mgnify:CR=1 FL=1
MSKYKVIKTEFKNGASLVKALLDLGVKFEESANLKQNNVVLKTSWRTFGSSDYDVAIAIQREAARKRMMAQVPKADVVITNPTHLAVAIQYRPESMAAPVVVAKGADFIAEQIRKIALENDVPLIENKPLAQVLYKIVKVNSMVPESLYRAVAEVLAFVYEQKKVKIFG